MQFWLGVVAGLSIGWLFDWLAGNRAIRANHAPELQDAPASPSPDDTSGAATATNDDAIAGDAVDMSA